MHTDVLHDVYTKSKIKITSNKHTKTRSNQTTENEIMSSVSGRELVSIICVYLQCMAIHFIFPVLLTFFCAIVSANLLTMSITHFGLKLAFDV